ncbi:hypothetical protein F4818DRAFT_34842 [Hypoxylon cercidicola]|nr:hypothetical protein F4818DRAFT_34842 [Hypoxylon cercidicola]
MAISASDCQPVSPSNYLDVPSVPDITGVGVLIGFISTAYVLLLIVCIYYVVTFNPALDPYRGPDDQSKKSVRPNPYDQLILRAIRTVLRIKAPELRKRHVSEALQNAFNKCVLSMADTQVFTGLGILFTGYLCRSGLSALHWKMTVYLAWFSCSTHLSALVFLRNYLINHPAERLWRLASMFALLFVLVVAMIPTGHFYWDDLIYSDINYFSEVEDDREFEAAPSANVTCYFNAEFKPSAHKARNAMAVSIVLLISGFATRVFKLHRKFLWFKIESISSYMVDRVLHSARFFQRILGTSTTEDRVVSNMVVAVHIIVCVWIDMYTSMASDIYWLIVSLAWGTTKIGNLITLLGKSNKLDNTWTFGQVLPVLLLALPMTSLVEHFLKSILRGKVPPPAPLLVNSPPCNTEIDDLQEQYPSMTGRYQADMPNREVSSAWILRPELLDEYYRGSIWMFWVVSICNAYTIMMTCLLLEPGTTWDGQLQQYVINDTVSEAQNMVVWFIFVQGVTVQIAILLTSLIEMKFKNRGVIHLMIFVTCGILIAASAFFYNFLSWDYFGEILGISDDMERYGLPLFCVLGTLGLFILALVVKQISAYLRSRGTRSDELLLGDYSTTHE